MSLPEKFNPVATKNLALTWIIVWKALDVVSTLMAERVHGTLMRQAEINILANLYGSSLGWDLVIFSTLPLTAILVSYFYRKAPMLVESLSLFLPFIVIGNFAMVLNPIYNLVISTFYLIGFAAYFLMVEYRVLFRDDGRKYDPLIWDMEFVGHKVRI